MVLDAVDLLICLVALAGQNDDVVFLCDGHGMADGFTPVHHHVVGFPGHVRAGGDIGDDGPGILRPGIVRGDDGDVRQSSANLAQPTDNMHLQE